MPYRTSDLCRAKSARWFLDVAEVYKIPANSSIFREALFLSFQVLCLGCCTRSARQLPFKEQRGG
jgi:hypothetical protein